MALRGRKQCHVIYPAAVYTASSNTEQTIVGTVRPDPLALSQDWAYCECLFVEKATENGQTDDIVYSMCCFESCSGKTSTAKRTMISWACTALSYVNTHSNTVALVWAAELYPALESVSRCFAYHFIHFMGKKVLDSQSLHLDGNYSGLF